MRKVLLSTALLLTLAVVLTTPTAAAKGRPGPPERGDEKVVEFTGDISSGGSTVTMIFHKKGGNIRFYDKDAHVWLDFSEESVFKEAEFSGRQECWNIVIHAKDDDGEPGEATTWIDFGRKYDDDVEKEIYAFHLEGFGTYRRAGLTHEIELRDTTVYEVDAVKSGKKGATGYRFINPVPLGEAFFAMTEMPDEDN